MRGQTTYGRCLIFFLLIKLLYSSYFIEHSSFVDRLYNISIAIEETMQLLTDRIWSFNRNRCESIESSASCSWREKVHREIFSIKNRRRVLSTEQHGRWTGKGGEDGTFNYCGVVTHGPFRYKIRLEKFQRQLRANLSARTGVTQGRNLQKLGGKRVLLAAALFTRSVLVFN